MSSIPAAPKNAPKATIRGVWVYGDTLYDCFASRKEVKSYPLYCIYDPMVERGNYIVKYWFEDEEHDDSGGIYCEDSGHEVFTVLMDSLDRDFADDCERSDPKHEYSRNLAITEDAWTGLNKTEQTLLLQLTNLEELWILVDPDDRYKPDEKIPLGPPAVQSK